MSRNELKDVEAALAHDLNNYLQVVMGNLEILRRRSSFVPEIVNAALNATRNAAQLADRLVAIGRLRSLEPRPLDLNQALADLREMISRTVGDSIRVEMDLAPGVAKALIDPRCLQIALLELATNAREAMPAGGKLSVRTRPANGLLQVELADTGAGMPAEKIARAFEPVFGTGDAAKPTGLGLHIVERCVRACGGRVHISSTPGKGTTVTLHLPTQ
jgi:signal transduction histidine kinase